MTAAAPPLAPDLTEGLRRLKLATMRRLAPELLLTARTQRWAPEELLRTLVEAEISARDASNARTRLKADAFPVTKTLDEFDLGVSSVPPATVACLASLEWITARENLCLVGPAGTGKSHLLVALGVAAVAARHKVCYFTAAELTETLYRGLADNSVGRIIGTLLRNDLILIDEVGFAPLDDTGAQLLFRVVAGRAARSGWAGGIEGVLIQGRAQLARIRPVARIRPGQYGRDRGERLGQAGPGVGGQGRPFHRGVRGGLLVPGDRRGFREVPRRRLAGQRIELQARPGRADQLGPVAVGEPPGDERL